MPLAVAGQQAAGMIAVAAPEREVGQRAVPAQQAEAPADVRHAVGLGDDPRVVHQALQVHPGGIP